LHWGRALTFPNLVSLWPALELSTPPHVILPYLDLVIFFFKDLVQNRDFQNLVTCGLGEFGVLALGKISRFSRLCKVCIFALCENSRFF
jgi:hypothetical protein